jgi:hypothetical protein
VYCLSRKESEGVAAYLKARHNCQDRDVFFVKRKWKSLGIQVLDNAHDEKGNTPIKSERGVNALPHVTQVVISVFSVSQIIEI